MWWGDSAWIGDGLFSVFADTVLRDLTTLERMACYMTLGG